MPIEYPLDVYAMVEYARRWAFRRNPDFYSFDDIGGDCTNFVSQCIYAGGAVMNYTTDTGWYYISPYERAASWTGVDYFYKFMTTNEGVGPFGEVVPIENANIGDVIQISDYGVYHHTMLIVNKFGREIYIAAHTDDAFNRPLSSYDYDDLRCIHIIGAKKYL